MIRFERLHAGYDGAQTLRDVNLCVPEGRLTALIGPNGCGKSTLMKTAVGLLKPGSGDILIGGKNIREYPPRQLAQAVAYMPQTRPAPEMTVGQLVTHGRYPHLKWGRSLSQGDRDIIRRAMERTETCNLRDKRADRISGGERQRAYIAMMLAQQSPIMLLDEPAAHLDLKAQFDLMELLRELAREGHTVFVVLHDLRLALEYSDHVALMQGGTIAAAGSPDEILDSGMLESVFHVEISRLNADGTDSVLVRRKI